MTPEEIRAVIGRAMDEMLEKEHYRLASVQAQQKLNLLKVERDALRRVLAACEAANAQLAADLQTMEEQVSKYDAGRLQQLELNLKAREEELKRMHTDAAFHSAEAFRLMGLLRATREARDAIAEQCGKAESELREANEAIDLQCEEIGIIGKQLSLAKKLAEAVKEHLDSGCGPMFPSQEALTAFIEATKPASGEFPL